MHVLLIAPSSPPENSPESMQVGRLLEALDERLRITLVTTPVNAGWAWKDNSLAVHRPRLSRIDLALPLHRFTQRLLANHRLSFLHQPDAEFWLPWLAQGVVRRMKERPDVIYSRSMPLSAALLASKLKRAYGVPWLMHLSDPWAGSPYRSLPSRLARRDLEVEGACFQDADGITLTTEGQADFYRERYPARAAKISVTPNVLPRLENAETSKAFEPEQENLVRLVHTGALYGGRDPQILLDALRLLEQRNRTAWQSLSVDFYGNMSPELSERIVSSDRCTWHGVAPYSEMPKIQGEADLLLSIEPPANHPLHLHFLQSKLMDYIARRKPILAITPKNSEAWRLCQQGHGWAVEPDDPAGLAALLERVVRIKNQQGHLPLPPDPTSSVYRVERVSAAISARLRELTSMGAA